MNKLINMMKDAYTKKYTELKPNTDPTITVLSKEEKLYNESVTRVIKVEGDYDIVEREIYPEKIICPDCGGITLEGLEYCDKCGGEIYIGEN